METTFDYVIVGAGSAGCALAGRLADSGDDTIALVEAGHHDHHVLVRTPAALAALLPRAGARNYGYETVPQPGLNGRRGYQPRGRGLGGSSSINAMIYTRGRAADYDAWAAAGCDGWSWDDVLPYFRRAECNERLAGSDDDPLHGGNGPLHVSDLRTPNPFAERFIEARSRRASRATTISTAKSRRAWLVPGHAARGRALECGACLPARWQQA